MKKSASLQLREYLTNNLIRAIKHSCLTQAEAAILLDVSQPRINVLLKGKVEEFSLNALVDMLDSSGMAVEISFRKK